MTRRADEGKRAWARRASSFPEELRASIESNATATVAAWDAKGRLPLWFRLKTRFLAIRRRQRAGPNR